MRTPRGGQRVAYRGQNDADRFVVVVVQDANERGDVGAPRETVAQHVAADRFRAARKSKRLQPVLRSGGDAGKIEQLQRQVRRALRRRHEKGAVAAADVEEASMPGERIGVENVLGDERLRSRHEVAIGAKLVRPRFRAASWIRPDPRIWIGRAPVCRRRARSGTGSCRSPHAAEPQGL